MDLYHSIVGPMVTYHWKPLKNHCVQWLPDYKTIEKPLALDQIPLKNHWYQWFAWPETIGTNGFQTKNHCKTIDTNGGFQTLHLLANPSLFRIFFVEKGLVSCSLISSALYLPHISHPKPKYKVNSDHWINHRYQWFNVKKPLENHW